MICEHTEEVRFPITIKVDGQPRAFVYASELTEFMPRILSTDTIARLIAVDESELVYTPDGVQVLGGVIVFNLICLDPACENTQFLITEING